MIFVICLGLILLLALNQNVRGETGAKSKEAYVTFLYGDEFMLGARVLGKSIRIPLTLYDPKESSSAKTVGCDDEFCKSMFTGQSEECKAGKLCAYGVRYGDGSSTSGYFVNDSVQIAQVSGNRQTKPMSGNIVFGCLFDPCCTDHLFNQQRAPPPLSFRRTTAIRRFLSSF